MANLSVESAAYINSQAQYLANAKASVFARFLNKSVFYVTYYVTSQMSTADAGTGAIHEEIGPQSPVRYNRVSNLPTYNLPELKPDVVNDEGGYNVEMEITDIAFIPGTVRPKPGDYMRLEIAGCPTMLFRCNNHRHNSIKSDDFYFGDFDLVDLGVQSQINRENSTELRNGNYLEDIEKQVDKRCTCRALDVGTNERYILEDSELDELNDADELIDTLTQFYNDAFYSADIDGFALMANPNSDGFGVGTQWYVDNYLTRFINESEIFRNDNSDTTIVLTYPDLKPLNFDFVYQRTVWYAVLKRTKDYLNTYTYAWNRLIQRRTSPLLMASIPAVHPTIELFDHYVTPEEPYNPELRDVVYTPGQNCGWAGADPAFRNYFSLKLVKSIQSGKEESGLNAAERMIFQYICQGINNVTYKKQDLLNLYFKQNYDTFMLLPITIYILKQSRAALVASAS